MPLAIRATWLLGLFMVGTLLILFSKMGYKAIPVGQKPRLFRPSYSSLSLSPSPAPPTFSAEAATHVFVVSRDATGVDTTLTQGVHYLVNLAGDGAVTIVPLFTMPPAPKTLVIYRDSPAIQAVDFRDGEDFSADIHEMLADRWARLAAERKADMARTMKVAVGELATPLPAAEARKGLLLGFRPRHRRLHAVHARDRRTRLDSLRCGSLSVVQRSRRPDLPRDHRRRLNPAVRHNLYHTENLPSEGARMSIGSGMSIAIVWLNGTDLRREPIEVRKGHAGLPLADEPPGRAPKRAPGA